MGELIVVLGNENDVEGVLSPAAIARCKKAFETIGSLDEDYKIIVTGGFGDFNKSDTAHAVHIEKELMRLGISKEKFCHRVISSGTHQDAIGVLRYLRDERFFGTIHVVTSKFHMRRATRIFSYFLPQYDLCFYGAEGEVSQEKERHEEAALLQFAKLRSNLAVAVDSDSSDLERLSAELRHYDTLAYYSLTAAFLIVAYTFSRFPEVKSASPTDLISYVQLSLSIAVSYGFLLLYGRFSDTAWIFRNLSKDLAFYLRKGDISNGPIKSLAGIKTRVWVNIAFVFGWSINILEMGKLIFTTK